MPVTVSTELDVDVSCEMDESQEVCLSMRVCSWRAVEDESAMGVVQVIAVVPTR